MKRFGPAMKDRRDKRLTERGARERHEVEDQVIDTCPVCDADVTKYGPCSDECNRRYDEDNIGENPHEAD